ncbi:MAG: hypothetical protein GY835_01175 [bacterium]|nr:hypothetical protein [bacterium]
MNKHLVTILTLLTFALLICVSGCNVGDSDAEVAGTVNASTVAADDNCGGCPDAATCGAEKKIAETAACDPAKCAEEGKACDPAKCAEEGKTCDPAKCAGHPEGCAGDGECTDADCAGCKVAEKCKAEEAAKATAQAAKTGCPSKCGGH